MKAKIQNLRNFTVQIRDINDQTVGTGFVVSDDGKIVTCVHVVKDASQTGDVKEGITIKIYFPQAINSENKAHQAFVVGYFTNFEDDVVVLQLDQSFIPNGVEIAILGKAEDSDGNDFRSFGYRRLANYQGLPASGTIIGLTEKPEDQNLQSDLIMLSSQHIDSGMSGGAVLDIERNLVIGIISETWDSGNSLKDRDTSFAVDLKVLTFFNCLNIKVLDIDIYESFLSSNFSQMNLHQINQINKTQTNLNYAPQALPEWVGRENFLENLNQDWHNSQYFITGLIGFGGEGKSSLTRCWIDKLLQNNNLPQPKKVFWWSFYEKNNIEEFFEALLIFIVEGIDPRELPSVRVKSQVINAMLKNDRYLFILDGLEILQYQEGDDYGLLKSLDLRDWLRNFSRGNHQSFCLINSRVPLLDLIDFSTYHHRDVESLTIEEGKYLLKKLGVIGTDKQLEKVVKDWDGYALILSLLASYLVDHYEGKIENLLNIFIPLETEQKYDRVKRILKRYDEHLTREERQFLEIFSAFRLPVSESALKPIFEIDNTDQSINNLISYRMIRYNSQSKKYTIHPLIRIHYLESLKNNLTLYKEVNQSISNYYLESTATIKVHPILDDLQPFIEAVYHFCQAENYDQASNLIDKFSMFKIIGHQLNAYKTLLSLMKYFFPKEDIFQEPQISDKNIQAIILNRVSLALSFLGKTTKAIETFQRCLKCNNEKLNIYVIQNLAELYILIGKLEYSSNLIAQSLNLAEKLSDYESKYIGLSLQGWVTHLKGNIELASLSFKEAESIVQIKFDKKYLYSTDGVYYVDHLIRIGNLDYAKIIAHEALSIAHEKNYTDQISQYNRILGDIESNLGNYQIANQYYEKAIKVALTITKNPIIIEALFAQGNYFIKQSEIELANQNLEEALNYALSGDYRIYEVDIRVALARLNMVNNQSEKAKIEANKALEMSEKMGYYWGNLDAKEILTNL